MPDGIVRFEINVWYIPDDLLPSFIQYIDTQLQEWRDHYQGTNIQRGVISWTESETE